MKIQAISWQAQASKQQDSFLISNGDICRIIQNKLLLVKPMILIQILSLLLLMVLRVALILD